VAEKLLAEKKVPSGLTAKPLPLPRSRNKIHMTTLTL